MRKPKKMQVAATLLAVTLLTGGLYGCKGRTMENMVPTGDTVEVDIPIPGEERPDSSMSLNEETPEGES